MKINEKLVKLNNRMEIHFYFLINFHPMGEPEASICPPEADY